MSLQSHGGVGALAESLKEFKMKKLNTAHEGQKCSYIKVVDQGH